MEAIFAELSKKATIAETSVKDIAMKAIESSSKPYFTERTKEISGKE